jgi:hypothetical protein
MTVVETAKSDALGKLSVRSSRFLAISTPRRKTLA